MSIEKQPIGIGLPVELEIGAGLWMHFSAHGTAADAEGLDTLLAQANFYFPEHPTSEEEPKKLLNRIVRGDYRALQRYSQVYAGSENFYAHSAEVLYKRPLKPKLEVAFVDVPRTSFWLPKMVEVQKLYKQFTTSRQGVDATLELHKNDLYTIAASQQAREEVIADNLAKSVPMIQENNPTATLLMPIGSMHTALLTRLADRGIMAQSTRQPRTIPVDSFNMYIQKRMTGKEVERDELLHGFFHSLIFMALPGTSTEVRIVESAQLTDTISNNDKAAILEEAIQWRHNTKTNPGAKMDQKVLSLTQALDRA